MHSECVSDGILSMHINNTACEVSTILKLKIFYKQITIR